MRVGKGLVVHDGRAGRAPALGALVFLGLVLALAVLWRFTSLSEWADPARLVDWVAPWRGSRLALAGVLIVYALGQLVSFPVTVLILATILSFGPVVGGMYALAGCLAGAATSFWMGRLLGRKTMERWGGARVRALNARLAKRGILAVVTVRVLPVAPFTVVNLVAGASQVRFLHFLIGTGLGMAPGVGALAVFGGQLQHFLENPSPLALVLLAGVAALLALLAIVLGRRRSAPSP